MLGYAVTSRIKCANPPHVGHSYFDHTVWWNLTVELPAPRVAVIQDIDRSLSRDLVRNQLHAANG
jgi:4-hydroxy-4-methyl-2-oxoglutarate aldolase